MFSECRSENREGVKEEVTDKEVLGNKEPAHKTDVGTTDAPEQQAVKVEDDDVAVQEAGPEEEIDLGMEDVVATEVPAQALASEE